MKNIDKHLKTANKSLKIENIYSKEDIDKLLDTNQALDSHQQNKIKQMFKKYWYVMLLTILIPAIVLLNTLNNNEVTESQAEETVKTETIQTNDNNKPVVSESYILADTTEKKPVSADELAREYAEKLKQTKPANEEVKSRLDTEHDITGLSVLELNPEELKNLNIEFNGNSYSYITEELFLAPKRGYWKKRMAKSGYDTTFTEPVLFRSKSIIAWKKYDEYDVEGSKLSSVRNPLKFTDSDEIRYKYTAQFGDKDIEYSGWDYKDYSRVAPVLWSIELHSNMIYSPLLHFGDEQTSEYYRQLAKTENALDEMRDGYGRSASENLAIKEKYTKEFVKLEAMRTELRSNYLVPVKLSSPPAEFLDNPEKDLSVDCYLWFIPNEEFLNAIPERYAAPIRKELKILSELKKNEIAYESACKGLSDQESFFDVCRMQSESIAELNLYPNPAINETTVSFIVLRENTYTVSLHDISGKFIKNLIQPSKYNLGTKEIKVSLGNLKTGMYLVAISSESGEHAMKRLIIGK